MGEEAKHSRNDEACALRGWTCIPLVVEVFGEWGAMKLSMYLQPCRKGSAQLCQPLNDVMYSRLSLTLVGQNDRAILAIVSHQPLARLVVFRVFISFFFYMLTKNIVSIVLCVFVE